MNSTILTVMRKELARFFGDYRMVMTTILLPGILMAKATQSPAWSFNLQKRIPLLVYG